MAYQPCKVSKKNGIMVYDPQITMLQQAGRSINPRNAIVQDLVKWMKNSHQKGESFILVGDFNEVVYVKSNLLQFCSNDKLQLVIILDCPDRKDPSTSLSDQKMIPAIRRSGYNKFDQ
eukprot:15351971-Ditylum_brightwellii.AAC.1